MTYKRNSRPDHHVNTGLKTLPFRCAAAVAFLAATLVMTAFAQEPSPLGWDPHLTFAGNFDVAYHNTQFFAPNHNVVVGQWDSRAEIWLWPNRKQFAWGPYVRVSG